MAYPPDRPPHTGAYDPVAPTDYPSTAATQYTTPPPATTAGRFGPTEPPYRRGRDIRDAGHEVREDLTREVTAGPFRFGLKEGVLGILGIFAALGIVLGILGFAAAFALDNAADRLDDGTLDNDPPGAAAELLPAILVAMLPFMAAPVLAIGAGAWAGHSSRDATIGSVAGGIGAFLGPILMLLLTGVGFALGAGAAGLDLSNVRVLDGWGIAPGWANTIPYLFTGAGLLWLLACMLGAALTGGVVGALLNRRWADRVDYRRRYSRRSMRY